MKGPKRNVDNPDTQSFVDPGIPEVVEGKARLAVPEGAGPKKR